MSDRAAPVWLPLERAMVCLSCDNLSDSAARRCPVCASESRMPLARWLGKVA